MRKEMIEKMVKNMDWYDADQFIADAKTWCKAIKDGRMICNVVSVSNSGMSRKLNFTSCEKTKAGYYYRNYFQFLKALGNSFDKNNNLIAYGCGMDMVFATNYDVIRSLENLKVISKKTSANLSQARITTI